MLNLTGHYLVAPVLGTDGPIVGVNRALFAAIRQAHAEQGPLEFEAYRAQQQSVIRRRNQQLSRTHKKLLPVPRYVDLGMVVQSNHSFSVLRRREVQSSRGPLLMNYLCMTTTLVRGKMLRLLLTVDAATDVSSDSIATETKSWIEQLHEANGRMAFGPEAERAYMAMALGRLKAAAEARDEAGNAAIAWSVVTVFMFFSAVLAFRRSKRISRSARHQEFAREQEEKNAHRDANGR